MLRSVEVRLGGGAGGPLAERQPGEGGGEGPAQTLGPLQQVAPGQLLHLGNDRNLQTPSLLEERPDIFLNSITNPHERHQNTNVSIRHIKYLS